MTHQIQAIIGDESTLQVLSKRLEHARVIQLTGGFGMVPMTDTLSDEITEQTAAQPPIEWLKTDQFMSLVPVVAHVISELSRISPIAYIETEYWGGAGVQSAVALASGQLLFGPSTSEQGPIDGALAAIGIQRTVDADEFDTLGLRFFRLQYDFDELDNEVYSPGYVARQFAKYGQPCRGTPKKPWWKFW